MSALQQMLEKWPSSIVARRDIGKFTGGVVSAGSMANADSAGCEPQGRFNIGKKVVYPVAAVVEWLEARSTFDSAGIMATARGGKRSRGGKPA